MTVKLLHILYEKVELIKNEWITLSDADKEELSDQLIKVVQTAYVGTNAGSFVNSLKDVMPSDWMVLDWDQDPEVDAAIFWRGPRSGEPWGGKKLQGLGHDGQKDSKKKMLSKMTELLKTKSENWWSESSGVIRERFLSHNVPFVKDIQTIQKVFPKTPVTMIDPSTGQYERDLGGKIIVETMFGHPII